MRESALKDEPTDDARRGLAETHFFLGQVQARLNQPDAALDHYAQAQTYRRQVYEANRHSFRARNDLATLSAKVGVMQVVKKDYAAAQKSFDENLKLCRELYAADTGNGAAQRRLSEACYMAAAAAQGRGDKSAAKAGFAESVRLRRDYVKAAPNDVNAHIELMLALARLGEHVEAVRIAEQEVRKRARASKDFLSLFQIACCYSLCLDAVEGAEDKAKYANQGVGALAEARALGHKDVNEIDAEPDLEPLRDRPEFQPFRGRGLPK